VAVGTEHVYEGQGEWNRWKLLTELLAGRGQSLPPAPGSHVTAKTRNKYAVRSILERTARPSGAKVPMAPRIGVSRCPMAPSSHNRNIYLGIVPLNS
jgi:hypothetical protein